jgi:predicted RNase H-like HicB family nuclease
MQMYMAQNTFTASIHKENNLYVATCVEIGTVSQGSTVEEALANLKEATSLYLEEFPVTAGAPVFLTTFTMEVYA